MQYRELKSPTARTRGSKPGFGLFGLRLGIDQVTFGMALARHLLIHLMINRHVAWQGERL